MIKAETLVKLYIYILTNFSGFISKKGLKEAKEI